MTGGIFVLLPAPVAHLSSAVLQAGCIPVVDATGSVSVEVPEGAWVRIRAGRPAPGAGPVILAELGAPIPDRETWLETSVPRDVPSGYAGLILKGREAGGLCGQEDGLLALSRCADPSRVILDAGLGPDTAAAAASLGAAGVLLVEPHLGFPEIGLGPKLRRRCARSDAEITTVVGGVRVANSPTAPVLRRLLKGEDPWALAADLYGSGDPLHHLWMVGQGLALTTELASRYGTLANLLQAYLDAWSGWEARVGAAQPGSATRTVFHAEALAVPDTAAGTGGAVGSGVLWQEARFLSRPITGGVLRAAMATGAPVVAPASALDAIRPAPLEKAPVAEGSEVGVAAAPQDVSARARPAIAIIGIGCLFPGQADSAESFWNNIVTGKNCIQSVPAERWDPSLYFDPEKSAPDRTYTTIGGFLTDFTFKSKQFRIPPKVATQVDPVQQITLTAVDGALRDANLQTNRRDKVGRPFDRARCAVILGNSLGGEVSDEYAVRLAWPAVERQLRNTPAFASLPAAQQQRVLVELKPKFLEGIPEINEDSMPGELANVIAGRVANAFDLGGANYTVDAACASSMAAIDNACKALQNHESDLVVTGGADRSMNIATYVKFCKIGALSPDHSAPFDASANGFVMGEGAGILVLKRYEDAVRDGDKIYAVIRGVGASSDGRGKGITAPNIIGQIRALERAYEAAGFAPHDVDLIEAHGTSTVVGDQVEVEALTKVIGSGARGDRGPIRLGSVKSMIGHLKSAAGAASCIKTALALHHGVYPPSINFQAAKESVPLSTIPLQVQTQPEPWEPTPTGVRRAGVSAFGFGGTNYHIVMESYTGAALPISPAVLPPIPQPSAPVVAPPPIAARALPVRPIAPVATPAQVVAPQLPDGVWATSGANPEEVLANLEILLTGGIAPFEPSSPMRVVAAFDDTEERQAQITRVIKTLKKGSNTDMLRGRGIHVEHEPIDGKLAFLFTGQGSQYANMGLDLAEIYPIVADTFAEADAILTPQLGRPITDYIRVSAGEDVAEKEEILKRTEYSQPATLTLDIAILRLLSSFGVQPDMVAGHSLGEYGAGVAAGVLTFEQALFAVSARGREMANIKLDDPGKMAGVAANSLAVQEVLAEVQGYVIPANKNCPTQTVIAGASDAVDEAVEMFRAKGVTVHPLPVSHAFHSKIVAPASEPLRGVLNKLGLKKPVRPITTNVTGDWYPQTSEAIVDLLAEQIWSPVEWVSQTERMYEAGARLFVECGPKRALAGFTVAILKRRPHRALYTNHPKRGGVRSFRDALAGLIAAGLPVSAQPGASDIFAPPAPRLATTEAIAAAVATQPEIAVPAEIASSILNIVAEATGYDVEELDLDYELEADLGIDTVKQAEVFSQIRDTFQIPEDDSFDPSAHKTLRSLIDWAGSRMGATSYETVPEAAPPVAVVAPVVPVATGSSGQPPLISSDVVLKFLESATEAGLSGDGPEAFASALLPAVQSLLSAAWEASQVNLAPFTRTLAEVVCSGASFGLPGGRAVFDEQNLRSILRGENRIDHIGARAETFLEKDIVRLVKDPHTGQGSFLSVDEVGQVIRLAGIRRGFDLAEWGADPNLVRALDITSQLAIAAGLEALRDAGIPLVRSHKMSASGKRVPGPWKLPTALQDGTGVIFASAFPGYTQFSKKLRENGDDGDGHFDRRFLFQVLSMGHSQFAQLIGAKGPNTALNAACASTTQAITIAEDWIRLGRCERVLVIGADDVTNEEMLPWIGSGFMAAGAATTKDAVEEAALPFDRRRHGMILGMGAVGLVLERADIPAQRGVAPISTLIASKVVNSAFHGSRLDVNHIMGAVTEVVAAASKKERCTPAEMAGDTFFMSHETYTPARGGSAAAEIESLRSAYGAGASKITIANTKGFTGHAMGAGIEDAVALKALQYGVVPPVANLREPDETLGELRLSQGEIRDFRYAFRLAAGFGSQLALTVWRREAHGDARVVNTGRRAAWLKSITGFSRVEEYIDERTLRVKEGSTDVLLPIVPACTPATLTEADFVRTGTQGARIAPVAAEDVPAPPVFPTRVVENISPARSTSGASVLRELTEIIAEKTGYSPDELESDFELEADLGIDTVKQAEVLSELTERYNLKMDDDFRLSEVPTIEALASYVTEQLKSHPVAPAAADAPLPTMKAPAAEAASATVDPPATVSTPTTPREQSAPSAQRVDVQDVLLNVIAEKTGYDVEELELDFELEADLGIDTVKQAEILADLREHFGFAQDDSFRFSDYPTIEALAAYLKEQLAAPPAPNRLVRTPLPFSPDPDPQDQDSTLEPLPRDITPYPSVSAADVFPDDLDRHALSSTARGATLDGVIALPPSFRLRRPILVDRPARPSEQTLLDLRVLVMGDNPTAEAVRQEILLRSGTLEGPYNTVVDLTPDAMAGFRQARFLDRDRPERWLTVTRMGGLDPVDGTRAWRDGARAGFTKALGREWDGCAAKVLDIGPSQGDLEVAQAVCDELRADESHEVFVDGDRRQIVRYKTEKRPASLRIKDHPVLLITGGARGICARIAQEYAQRGSCTLLLIGRSEVPEVAYDLDAEKERIKAQLKAAGERATPAKIEKQLGRMRRANEAVQTIEALRAQKGVTVEYRTCDLADPVAAADLVREVIHDLGRIDICIHGAGAEESRLIAEKDEASWHRIFDGKALGGRAMIEVLPESVVFVSMGSVAGRFGNPGQVDYAAANDAMARRCLAHPNALHVDWTAWDDVGMASGSAMKRILEQKGVDLLPADAGAALLVDMVAAGVRGEIVVAGRLGDFQTDPGHPLLDRVEMDGDIVRGYRELSVSTDPWILDHAIDGVPLLPGVIGIELMASVAGMVCPESSYTGAVDVKFLSPVKIHGDQSVLLVIEAEPVSPTEVLTRVIAVRALRTGRIRRQEHFTARILMGRVEQEVEPLPNAFLPDEVISSAEIYKRFFHGPIFQVLRGVYGVSADGLLAEASTEPESIAQQLVSAPLALEAAFQASGLHGIVTENMMTLPMSVETLHYYQPSEAGHTLSVTVRKRGQLYDIDVNALNAPILRVRGFAMVERGPIPENERFPEPAQPRPNAFPTSFAGAAPSDDPRAFLTEHELRDLMARGTARRIADRVAGRIAAKRALSGLTGVEPLKILVSTAASGEPIAEVPGWPDVRVSLSHRDGHAVAVAVPRGRIGVDLEGVVSRRESFRQMWLLDGERTLATTSLTETVIWSAKEAVLKALGTGMAIAPRHVEVVGLEGKRLDILLHGPAAERFEALGGGELYANWEHRGEEEVVVRVEIAA